MDTRRGHYPDYILPGPGPVWDSFKSDWDRGVWVSDVEATLEHLFAAYALTIALGLPIGILIGRYWVAEDLTACLPDLPADSADASS